METPFETWLIWQIFEVEQLDAKERERWTGRYFLATDKQKTYASTILERLILPDQELLNFQLKLNGASVEYCAEIIDELVTEFETQGMAFDPLKRLKYYQEHL